MELKYEEQWILDALKAVILEDKIPGFDKNAEDSIISLAKRHGVLNLLYTENQDLWSPGTKASIKKGAQNSVGSFYRLLYMSLYLTKRLEKEGVCFALIKGIDLASLYPVPEYRSFGDIDILLTEESHLSKALSVLSDCGFKKEARQDSDHHISYKDSNGIVVELHTAPVRAFDSGAVNERIKEILISGDKDLAERTLFGRPFPVLKDPQNALYIMLHMLQHYLNAGFGLRFLVDWCMFWKNAGSTEVCDEYKGFCKEIKISGFSDAVTYLSCKYLGLSKEKADMIIAGDILKDPEEQRNAERLLSDIFESGSFGSDSADRVVNIRNASFLGLFLELHHQTKRNYPKLSKCFLLWPFLWLGSAIIFLKNNRSVRHVSTKEVLAKSKERGRLTEGLKIWKE